MDSLLQADAKNIGLDLSDQQTESLLEFMSLVQEWNRVYNLTAITDPVTAIERHVLDSLSVGPYLEAEYCLDVGTGAGFPGIPLALVYDKTKWVLVDRTEKKIRFLNHVIMHFNLGSRVEARHARVETLTAPPFFDGIISRAFSNGLDFFERTGHLLAPGGCFYAMKGMWIEGSPEYEAVKRHPVYQIKRSIALKVPGCSHRHLVVGSQRGIT